MDNTVNVMPIKPLDYCAPVIGEIRIVTTSDGTRLHTVSAGTGQPIVLAHGFAVDIVEWNVIAASLVAQGYRVIAFDQRGHGKSTIGSNAISSESMASDYAAILNDYDVHDAVLVMHSMAGFIGIRFLVDYPDVVADRIKSILLLATFAGDINRNNPQNRVQLPLIRSGILSTLIKNKWIGKAFANSLLGDNKDPAMAHAFLTSFQSQNLRPLVAMVSAMSNENRYDRLEEIAVPCTIMVGAKDKTTPAFHTDLLHAGIADSKLVRVPAVGHLINWEASDQVITEIVALAQ